MHVSSEPAPATVESFAALVNAFPIAVYALEDGRFTHVNDAFATMLGYSREDILAFPRATDVIVERELVEEISRQRRNGDDAPRTYVVHVRCRNGSLVETEIHSSVAYAGDRRLVVGAALDVTERSNAARQIAEREEYFRALTENVSDVIAIVDPSGRVSYVSPSVERILGYTPQELIGEMHFASVHPDDRGRVVAAFRRLVVGVPYAETYRFARKDGRWRVLESTGTNLLDHPQIRGIVINTRDVTDRKRLEQELEQLNRLTSLGRLAAQVAHEFNNVLMGIQPVVDIMRRLAGGDPQRLRLADLIAASIARGKRVTTEVLRFGTPAQPHLQPVDTSELLLQVADEIRGSLPAGIELDVQVPENAALHAMADRAQLSQVLINLALNARDAMEPRGGTLTVAVHPSDEDCIEFSVTDTGHGIPQEDIPFIFEPLFSTKRNGTGLGLSIVFQIVSAHRGHVAVESVQGAGSTFRVRIPSVREEQSRDDAANEESIAMRTLPRKRRVLVVEDDEAIGTGLQLSLEEEGIEVSVVSRADAALPAIERARPDVIVLDLNLADDEGSSVYARIAQRFEIPVIFSTGHAREHEIELLLAAPRTAVLMKPYSTEDLLRTIERLAEERRGI